jgi:hypothetical protein
LGSVRFAAIRLRGAVLLAMPVVVLRVVVLRVVARRTLAVLTAPAPATPASAAAAAVAIAFAIGGALALGLDDLAFAGALARPLTRLAILIVVVVCGRAVGAMIMGLLVARKLLASGLRTIGRVAFAFAGAPRAPPAPPPTAAAAFLVLAAFAARFCGHRRLADVERIGFVGHWPGFA